MPLSSNTVQRRTDLLAEAITSRVNQTYKALTEPEPAFMVQKPEEDQVKEYINQVNNGQLRAMRKSNGGQYDDEDVDRYVSTMQRLIPKHASTMYGAVPAGEPPAPPEF